MYPDLMDKYNDDFSKAQEKFREIVFEEILHSITVRELKQHLEFYNAKQENMQLNLMLHYI